MERQIQQKAILIVVPGKRRLNQPSTTKQSSNSRRKSKPANRHLGQTKPHRIGEST